MKWFVAMIGAALGWFAYSHRESVREQLIELGERMEEAAGPD
jgi:hypothetical protein